MFAGLNGIHDRLCYLESTELRHIFVQDFIFLGLKKTSKCPLSVSMCSLFGALQVEF